MEKKDVVIVVLSIFVVYRHMNSCTFLHQNTHDMRTSHTHMHIHTCTAGRLARCRAAIAMCPTYSTLPTWLGDPMYKSEKRGTKKRPLFHVCVCDDMMRILGCEKRSVYIEEKARRD